MATQGPRYPTSVNNVIAAPEDDDGWVNPTFVGADDANEAVITAATFDAGDTSKQMVTLGYGFTIPSGSTIDGITVEIMRRNSAGAASDFRVQLRNAAGSLIGTNKADTATDWPTAEALATYGGAADTWTASPTVAMVNDASFGVVLSVDADAANTDVQVRYVRITINYTAPTVEEHSGTLSVSGGGNTTLAARKAASLGLGILGGGSTVLTAGKQASLALSVTGGGQATIAGVHTGTLALSVSGGGSFTFTYDSDNVEVHSGTLSVSGGGSTSFAAQAGKALALAIAGGGSASVSARKGAALALAITGGGQPTVGVTIQRLASVAISGGGSMSAVVSTGRRAALAVSGGGVVGISAASSNGPEAILTVSGGGGVTIQGMKNARVTSSRRAVFGTYEQVWGDHPRRTWVPGRDN